MIFDRQPTPPVLFQFRLVSLVLLMSRSYRDDCSRLFALRTPHDGTIGSIHFSLVAKLNPTPNVIGKCRFWLLRWYNSRVSAYKQTNELYQRRSQNLHLPITLGVGLSLATRLKWMLP